MEGIAGNFEDERKSKYYYQSWTQEAVCRYLYSKVKHIVLFYVYFFLFINVLLHVE